MKIHPIRTVALVAANASATPVLAQQPTAQPPAERTIRVSGIGQVQAQPDEAYIDFAVETLAPTAKAASEENARTLERVIAALVKAGVSRREIQTRGFSVFPEYFQQDRDTVPRIRGYRVTNTVSLRTQALDRVGAFLDAALGAGANRVNGVRFAIRNADAVQAEAMRSAVQQARASAEAMAASLGVRLGPILDASTAGQPPRPVYDRATMRVAEEAQAISTPIEPGEQTVTAIVSLVFAIGGAR